MTAIFVPENIKNSLQIKCIVVFVPVYLQVVSQSLTLSVGWCECHPACKNSCHDNPQRFVGGLWGPGL